MKLKIFFHIAIRIVILFSMGFFMSYLSEYLRPYFGDTMQTKDSYGDFINDGYDWGARHYWYFWCMFCLFILSLIDIFISIFNLIDREYKKYLLSTSFK